MTCELDFLTPLGDYADSEEFHRCIAAADVLFVMDGSALRALRAWRTHGINNSLRDTSKMGFSSAEKARA